MTGSGSRAGVGVQGRLIYFGADPAVRKALAAAAGRAPEPQLPASLQPGDVVVVPSFGGLPDAAGRVWAQAAVAGGNAFSACRALKENRGVGVFVAAFAGDPVAEHIARFVLADGTLWFDRATGRLDARAMQRQEHQAGRRIDDLLARLQGAITEPSERSHSALERLLQFEREDDLMSRLQDPETGLFDGPYAALKLDEEWKRAMRFHSPLALLLLEIQGPDGALAKGPARRATLAEVAGVFLNECRDIDVLARFTETTFLFLLPGTGLDGASILARRMLEALRVRTFGGSKLLPAAGLAVVPAAGITDRRAFLSVAEACLRRARATGGDSPLATDWE